MKLIKIKHYVEKSLRDLPAFILTMSDNKDYISHGCQFVEHTEENVLKLIKQFNCEKELMELLQAPPILTSELVNGAYMFDGCESLIKIGNFPLLSNGYYMFKGCKSLTEVGDFPSLIDGAYMFDGCSSLTEVGDFPSLIDGFGMFDGCESLIKIGNFPLLVDDYRMFYGCESLNR